MLKISLKVNVPIKHFKQQEDEVIKFRIFLDLYIDINRLVKRLHPRDNFFLY